ncbi:putative sulfate exporter family transporter [Eubacteriales bacterium OttesenSCG-928-A19]|nr:putative sulfate exporter family transporter [Eubacteriales bacterium OttesenSCG-928-A19]
MLCALLFKFVDYKLTRTLAIIPTVLVFSAIQGRMRAGEQPDQARGKVNLSGLFPYFILFFLAAVAIKSLQVIPASWSAQLGRVSEFCMVMALGAIGAKTSFREMAKSGIKPMLHGVIISLAVVLVALWAQYILGLI